MNRNYRILISHSSVYKMAGWGRIYPLASGLAKHGHSVTILTTNRDYSISIRKYYENNIKIIVFPEVVPYRISKLGFGLLSLILKIFYAVSNNFDIVQSDNGHRPLGGIPCRINKRIFKSIYVAEWYDWYGRGGQYDSKKRIFKFLLGWYELYSEIADKKFADGIVVLSEVLRKRALNIKPKDRVIKIHGGADVTSIPFTKDNSVIKKKHGLSDTILTLGYITSDSYNMVEFSPIIDAIQLYNYKREIRILIFGDSSSIEQQLTPAQKDYFIFMGWIDYSKDFEKLQMVDAFFLYKDVTLGNRAGWPNCLGDYLACGRCVVLNPVGEPEEFVKKFPFAFYITTRNSMEISIALKGIIDDFSNVVQYRSEIRMIAENHISWDSKSIQLSNFYNYLSENKF